MPDMDRIINAMEVCLKIYPYCGPKCSYYGTCHGNRSIVMGDALEALKEKTNAEREETDHVAD